LSGTLLKRLPLSTAMLYLAAGFGLGPAGWVGLLGAPVSRNQRAMIAWLGIRRIGSIYCLMSAIQHGLPRPLAEPIIAVTLAAVTVSILSCCTASPYG